jgi:hypothetical protein
MKKKTKKKEKKRIEPYFFQSLSQTTPLTRFEANPTRFRPFHYL